MLHLSKNSKLLTVIAVFAIAAGVLAMLLVVNKNQSARMIASGSTLEDARKLSAGKKEACLTDSQDARAAVKEDDVFYGDNDEYSEFEAAASLGIIDVPAGTNYEVTIQRYDGTLAQGALKYDGEYGAYNYTIEKTAGQGEWRFVSMIACEQ